MFAILIYSIYKYSINEPYRNFIHPNNYDPSIDYQG